LQLSVRTLNPAFKGRLQTEVDRLVEGGIITRQLGKNAHELRILANETAHPQERETDAADWVSLDVEKADAEEALIFMDDFLETALAVPARQARREAERTKRDQ